MNQVKSIIKKEKFKHLSDQIVELIINEYNEFLAATKATYKKSKKIPKRNIGKTEFLKGLSKKYGTSLSNIYKLIKSAKITVVYDYKDTIEYCASAVINRRKMNKPKNNFKIEKAEKFIELVVFIMKGNKLASVDETIHDLIYNHPELIKGMETISTSTMYTYIKIGLLPIKPIDLPRMVRRKPRKSNFKEYMPKNVRGTSIDERPDYINNRSEFGHWEGDLVTGPRDGQKGAILTLVERQYRFMYQIPIKNKKAKTVYMAINKLAKHYGEYFSIIFKSITFDNGKEFSRYHDIENRYKIKIYFAHPYCAYERGTNEIANQLIRYFIPKGTNINTLSKDYLKNIQILVNNKKRKILNYQSSESLFLNKVNELTSGKITELYYQF